MGKIFNNLTEIVGHTPLMEVSNIEKSQGLDARVLVKIESFNPGGSVKDRPALAMIEAAEKRGMLKPGGTIVEPTSGNMGIGLAWVASVKGYKAIIVMPDTMSVERQNMLKALGAELVLTPGAEGMKGAIAKAEEIEASTPGAVLLQQFQNPANPEAHVVATGEEIWDDTDGHVDVFVAGVGTGGTVSGVGKALKARNPAVEIIAVEPSASPVLSGGNPAPHKIQGLGAGFVPGNYDGAVVDKVMTIDDTEAVSASRKLAKEEGLLAGISSGAALAAALKLAAKPEYKGKTIVALLPDTGERYMSTVLYSFDDFPA